MRTCLRETMVQAWLDGELSPQASAEVRAHLADCSACAARAGAAEQALALVDDAWQADLPALVPTARLRARVEESLSAQPAPAALFARRAAFMRWQFAAAFAVLVIAVIGAFVATRLRQTGPAPPQEAATEPAAAGQEAQARQLLPDTDATTTARAPIAESARGLQHPSGPRPPVPGAVSTRPASRATARATVRTWVEPETNKHLGQTQLLLRSVRNAEPEMFSDLDYERELARELLSRNRLLRRRAEHKDDMRTEELLSHIEPLLLDIANLPGRPAPDEMRSLQELISEQQIIAELQLYTGKNGF